jgi:hypothetical protein
MHLGKWLWTQNDKLLHWEIEIAGNLLRVRDFIVPHLGKEEEEEEEEEEDSIS